MRSIRTKIINVLFASITFTVVVILMISVISISILSEQDSDQLLKHIGEENISEIEYRLKGVESAVESIFYYAEATLDRVDSLGTYSYRSDYLDQIESMVLAQTYNCEGAAVVYFRMNTDYEAPFGFIYSLNPFSGKFEKGTLTDISLYDENDIEHVGWYYLPRDSKKPLWIGPYHSLNLNIEMISYVAPLYVEGRFVGIMGIDVDLKNLLDDIDRVGAYENGNIMLVSSEGELICSKDRPAGLSSEEFEREYPHITDVIETSLETGETVKFGYYKERRKIYAGEIGEGLRLCISIPVSEIAYAQKTVLFVSILVSLSILAMAMYSTHIIISGFLKPLRDLTTAAEQLADGKMDVDLNYSDEDEIGALSKTFVMMSTSLRHYFDHFHSLAYTDKLTGLNNKAAFDITKGVIESEMDMGRASFSIVVMDVNNLKKINDSLGHEKGDLLLQHATQCMRTAFTGYPLYRIGGDEFCSIVNNDDPRILIERMQGLVDDMSKKDYPFFGIPYQVAAGCAVYNRGSDPTFADVFNRADEAMYVNKKALKEKEKWQKY